MKSLLNLPIVTVLNSLSVLRVKEPITVQDGLYYLMFMQAVADDLEKVGGDVINLSMEHIIALAKEHGGYVEKDCTKLFGADSTQAMLYNASTEMFYIRLASYTANLVKQ